MIQLADKKLSLAGELLSSDQHYFKLASRVIHLEEGKLFIMSGFERYPVGAVVHHLERCPSKPEAFIRDTEALFSLFQASHFRFYLSRPLPYLESVLLEKGYERNEEVGFLLTPKPQRSFMPLSLKRVQSPSDWQAKLAFHMSCQDAQPDGHAMPPADWVKMERNKALGGGLEWFLVYQNKHIVGTFGLLTIGPFLRFKNLVVSPHCRRQGMATRFVEIIRDITWKRGLACTGCYALRGKIGEKIYNKEGIALGPHQWEWIRKNPEKL